MNARLAKELRALRLAWCVATLTAAGHLLAVTNPVFAKGEFGSFLVGLAILGFFGGCLVLAALPLGSEVQERTLVLLLSQPVERLQLWKEKLLAGAIAVGALALVHWLTAAAAGRLIFLDVQLAALYMIAAICSVGFWTVATRSVLLGVASAVSVPLWIAFSIHITIYYGLRLRPEFDERTMRILAVCAGAVYSAFFLWAGRRQFALLEAKDPLGSRAAQVPAALVPNTLKEAFRCRPTGALGNLIRKEVCLHKPVFLIGAIFAICWVLTLVLLFLEPVYQEVFEGFLNGITGAEIMLVVILAGCASLPDERTLGVHGWHSTLPVSARRQWLVKLGVSVGVLVLVGLVLPFLLALVTTIKAEVGLVSLVEDKDRIGLLWVGMAAAMVFVMSFWAASFFARNVQAAAAAMFSLVAIGVCANLGAWLSAIYFPAGVQTELVARLASRLQIPPGSLATQSTALASIGLVVLVAGLVALGQSLAQFHRTQIRSAVTVKCSLVLAAVILAGSAWCGDLMRSFELGYERFEGEVMAALRSLPLRADEFSEGRIRTVSLQELEKTGKLSSLSKAWLGNSSIELSVQSKPRGPLQRYTATFRFSNGKSHSLDYRDSRPLEQEKKP